MVVPELDHHFVDLTTRVRGPEQSGRVGLGHREVALRPAVLLAAHMVGPEFGEGLAQGQVSGTRETVVQIGIVDGGPSELSADVGGEPVLRREPLNNSDFLR